MRERHVTQRHYEAVERGDLAPEALQRRFRDHALELCPVCDHELEEYVRGRSAPSLLVVVFVALMQRLQADFARIEEAASLELAELMALSVEQRKARVSRARKRFRNPLLADLLIDRSRARVFADPREAAELARLAFHAAMRIEPSPVLAGDSAHEPMTRALAHEANALRSAGDLKAADRSMKSVLANLPRIEDPVVQSEILSLAASLRRDQRRFEEAHRFIDLAIQLDEENGRRHAAGEKSVVKSQVFYDAGALDDAIRTAEAALARLDRGRDSRLYLCTEHTLMCYLVDGGRAGEALRRYRDLQGLYERFAGEPTIELRRRWLAGKLAQQLGNAGEAERELAAARDGFITRGDGFHAALVALDLALLFEAEGRLDDLQQLSLSMLPVFRSQDVHREALAALALFVQAASRKAVPRPLIESLAEYLRRARHDSSLRFEPPG